MLEVLKLKTCAARIASVVQSAEAMLQRPCGPAEYFVLMQALEGPLAVFRAAGVEPPAASLVMGELKRRTVEPKHPVKDAERRAKGDPMGRWLSDLVRESDLAAKDATARFTNSTVSAVAMLGGGLWVAAAKTPEERLERARMLRDSMQKQVDKMRKQKSREKKS